MLEILQIAADLAAVLTFLSARNLPGRRWGAWFTVAAAAFTIAHAVFEGSRWQMFPVYLLTAALTSFVVWYRFAPPRISWIAGLISVAVLGAGVSAAALMPVFAFPAPTGPYRVGTEVRHLVDRSRAETGSPSAHGPRELMIQIWYPAALRPGGRFAAYRTYPGFSFRHAHMVLVRTHAEQDAGLSAAIRRYPVLLFSPSWGGQRMQNTFQTEDLASHGFVVIGIDYPYGSEETAFPDGRVVYAPSDPGEDYSSEELYHHFLREGEQWIDVRARDASFLLDELERIDLQDPNGRFTGRLDLSRVGIFGHSFGGAVAAEACARDHRFLAGMDMDGLLFGLSAKAGVAQPFLFMTTTLSQPAPAALASSDAVLRRRAETEEMAYERIRLTLARSHGTWIMIEGVTHKNFCDSPLFSPWRRLTGAGPIDPLRAMDIINAYTLAFFRQHLLKTREPLLDGPSPADPEVVFSDFGSPRASLGHTALMEQQP